MEEIFGEDEKIALKDALALAKQLRTELARAKLAGIDVGELERNLTEAEGTLRNIQRVYGRKS